MWSHGLAVMGFVLGLFATGASLGLILTGLKNTWDVALPLSWLLTLLFVFSAAAGALFSWWGYRWGKTLDAPVPPSEE